MPETDEIRMSLTSPDVLGHRIDELRVLFPEAFAEGKIDFEKLRQALGDEVDTRRERYGLSWAGKAEAIRNIQRPSVGTLVPCPDESVNFDTTENLFIEGDNLEVLKLLQKSYYGKVKMIYIDPPYNTGNEFIYPDNYREGLEDYLRYSGQVNDAGVRQSTNTETSGRYHSKWLSMMYPRLFLARNLLGNDGAVFVSIGEDEIHDLRLLIHEIFGEENFIATVVWQKSKRGDAKLIAQVHDYILVAARDKQRLIESGVWRQKKDGVDEVLAHYQQLRTELHTDHGAISERMRDWYSSLPSDDPKRAHKHYQWSDNRGLYFADNFHGPDDGRESRPRYDILHPTTGKACKKPSTGWRWSEERTKQALAVDPPLIHFGPDETTIPCRKTYLSDVSHEPFASVFYRDGRAATLELERLVGPRLMDFPKNTDILKQLIEISTDDDALILDFFAGSCSTAHAVLELNRTSGGARRFIMVQLPEPLEEVRKLESGRLLRTIADVGKQRVRRVLEEFNAGDNGSLGIGRDGNEDRGFRVFNLTASNFKIWDATSVASDAEQLGQQLKLFADHVLQERTEQSILYELILKAGLPMTAKIETKTVADNAVYSIAEGMLLICLANPITQECLRGMMELQPQRVVCLDPAFQGNDQLKTNTVLEMKTHGIEFRTV